MPVYVDPLFDTKGWSAKWPFDQASHMMADTDEELHAMATKIGLKRSWHQKSPPHSVSHYDLTPGKRTKAVKAGAIEVERGFTPAKGKRPPYMESLF